MRIARVESHGLQGRALVAAARGRDRDARLRAAEKAARRVGRESLWCTLCP